MKPSIGRIVHFVGPAVLGISPLHSAIITFVIDDRHVDLTVFRRDGEPFFETNIDLDPTGLLPDSWHWPERVVGIEKL